MRHSCAGSSFLLSAFSVQYRVDLLLTLLGPSSKAQPQFINCWDYFIIGSVDIFFMTMNLRFVDLKIDTENITRFLPNHTYGRIRTRSQAGYIPSNLMS